MESIISLLRRIVALLTALVMTLVPGDVSADGNIALLSAEYPVMPLVMPFSSLVGYYSGSLKANTTGYQYFYRNYYVGGSSVSNASGYSSTLAVGVPVTLPSGSRVTVSWSGVAGGAYRLTGGGNNVSSGSGWSSSLTAAGYTNTSIASSLVPLYIGDHAGTSLISVDSLSGSVSFELDHDVSAVLFYVKVQTSMTSLSNSGYRHYLDVSSFDISVTSSNPIDDAILGMHSGVSDLVISNRGILDTLEKLTGIASTPSALEQLQDRYMEKMEDQLSQVEDMMDPSNTALPNNGDIAGFVSDIQDGLGVNGGSFNPSEFSDALSAFGDASSTGAGGPWEFFTEAVRDSLAGDTSPAGLADDDYIYAWLEQLQGRYDLWGSSSP